MLRDITLDFTHDLGFGTYFTPVKRIAEEFSEIRKSVPAAPRVIGEETLDNVGVVLRLTVKDRQVFGRTLDLLDGPLAQEWAEQVALRARFTNRRLANEAYYEYVEQFLASKGTSLAKYETVIAWDYLHNGPQICIKSDEIVRKLVLLADEIIP